MGIRVHNPSDFGFMLKVTSQFVENIKNRKKATQIAQIAQASIDSSARQLDRMLNVLYFAKPNKVQRTETKREREGERKREKKSKILSREPIFKFFVCVCMFSLRFWLLYSFYLLFSPFVRPLFNSFTRTFVWPQRRWSHVFFFFSFIVCAYEKPIGNTLFISLALCVCVVLLLYCESPLRGIEFTLNNHYLRMPSVCCTSF